MENMSLREKLDAIEACEKLIQFYGNKLKSWDNKFKGSHEEGFDDDMSISFEEAAPIREKYEYYKQFRNDLMEELEKDPVLGVIDKARMI